MAATMGAFRQWGKLVFRANFCRSAVRRIHNSRMVAAAHDAEFKASSDRVQTLKEAPDNQVKLQLYALFKQGSSGKCNTPKPGAFDFVGKAKWTAWNELGDISQDDAQLKYISLVNELVAADGGAVEEAGDAAAAGSYQFLKVESSEGIFTITLNRPSKKNAITREMYQEIISALGDAANDKSCKLAVLTGAGDYYCSGNDLSNFASITPDQIAQASKEGKDLLKAFVASMIDFPKPLIGVVNGPSVGVATTTLGLCDVVYATSKATFVTPMVALGQSPEGCSSLMFVRLMGQSRANEMLLFGKKITAQQACDWGLVTQVFPDETFHKEVWDHIKEISKLPKQSLQLSKELMRSVDKDMLHKMNTQECDLLEERWQSNECIQAVMEFFQKKTKD